ncbi:hypothetical protein Nepgr_031961 [Nepenthes gracilis]|uniref:Uncharacterized protein n=1 Tax=Nepenthes gracilis TaxID=150966 RepID=A0AAD3Y5N9_NEPGR|nr:hypothetical protein Nepgr_031961 [Nepenthes gracilis]
MNNFEVEIFSRRTIKPSSPTPHNLRSFKISFLDQMSPVLYTPLILFYASKTGGRHPPPQVKESLSETLTKFYPLAGRIKDNFTIDCNDEGIPYVEAKVHLVMLEFLRDPPVESLGCFLPRENGCPEPITELPQVCVQVTRFDCGGMAIGVCFFHKIMDGASIGTFLKTWAAAAGTGLRTDVGEICPDLTAASSLFPAKDLLASYLSWIRNDPVNVVLRRFVFEASAVSDLRARAKSELVPNPSRVQAVSGFIWKHVGRASDKATAGDEDAASLFIHSVNIRPRGAAPLPWFSIGNLYQLAMARCDRPGEENEAVLVSRLREAISKVDDDHVDKLGREEEFMRIYQSMINKAAFKNTIKYWCTSWCKLGLNDIDFGWGTPVWIGVPWGTRTSTHRNQITMIENSCDGVEAWLVLSEEEMSVLEDDAEFLAFASPNPTVRL